LYHKPLDVSAPEGLLPGTLPEVNIHSLGGDMRVKHTIVPVVLILFASSCNLPSNQPTTTPLPPPEVNPSSTPIPIETLLTFQPSTLTPTATPIIVLAFPKTGPVNCRSGTGVAYNVVSELPVGRQAEIVGKSPDLVWWYVKNPSDPSTFCWLAADFTLTQGNVEALAVVSPPAIVVTAVDVNIDPPVINTACNAFPRLVTINVRITTNGPATVLWRWEEVNSGDVSPDQNSLFDQGGSRSLQELYQVKSARDYRIIVRTLAPNEVTGEATFKAVCTP